MTTERKYETEGASARVKRHTVEMLRLATPIVVSRSGFLVLVMADTVMTGQHSSDQLAYLAIALGLVMPLMITSLGLIMGTLVLSANEFGAGRFKACGTVWRRSLTYAMLLGLGCVLIGWNGELLLRLAGQSDDVSRAGGEIMRIISFGLPGHLLFLSSAYFLEGIGRPSPSMVVMVGANVLNVALNWLLIGGYGDVGPMGAAGAAWATTVARWTMAGALALYVWNMKGHARFGLRDKMEGGFRSWRELRRIGYAIGVSVGVESLAFSTMNIFAGWLGKMPLAAYGITLNLMALIFMLAIGIGSATAVRVGVAHGRGDFRDASLAGWTGLVINAVAMIIAGFLIYIYVDAIAGFYTSDPLLLVEALVTIAFIAWLFVPDGGQAVMANALRGRKDVWAPSIIQTTSFFGVMVPVGYYSAFIMGNGTVGLFHGILIGCIVSLTWLGFRFHILARRDVIKLKQSDAK